MQISMVDATLFERLDSVARHVRKCNAPFGGIQLILTGAYPLMPLQLTWGASSPVALLEQLSA